MPIRIPDAVARRTAFSVAWAAVRRRPPIVTLALVIAIAAIAIRLQVGGQLPALRFLSDGYSGRAIVEGHYRVLLTSTLLTRDVFMVVSICISLLVTMGTYEVLAGHVRAALIAVVASVLGPVSVTAALGLLFALGSTWADTRLDTIDIGASAIVAMSSGAIAGFVRDRRLTVGLVLFLIGGLVVHHQLADWEHVLVFPWGYCAGHRFGAAPLTSRVVTRRSVSYAVAAVALSGCAVVASDHVLPSPQPFRDASGAIVAAPRLVTTQYPTPSMHGSRAVLVLLPPGYDHSTRRFPVVELLHGDPGRPTTLVSAADLADLTTARGVAPAIVVIPDGHGPAVTDSWFANIPSQAVGTAVTRDLRRWVTSRFRTTGSWSYGGMSSGGFAAAYLPLIDAAPVHAVCAIGGFYDGNIPLLAHATPTQRDAANAIAHASRAADLTFIGYGTHDSVAKRQSRAFAAALRRVHKRVIVREYPGGHSWPVWTAGLRDCFHLV